MCVALIQPSIALFVFYQSILIQHFDAFCILPLFFFAMIWTHVVVADCCYCRHVIACGRRSNKTMMMNDLNCFGRSGCQAESALTLNVCIYLCVGCCVPFFRRRFNQNEYTKWFCQPVIVISNYAQCSLHNHNYHLWTLNEDTIHTDTHSALLSKFYFFFLIK